MVAGRRDHETSSSCVREATLSLNQCRNELAAHPLELTGVSVELVATRAAPGKHLTYEDESACMKQKVVDLMVENG